MTNRVQPEVSIAEAYIANEAFRVCAVYLGDTGETSDDESVNQEDTQRRPSLSLFSQRARPFGPQESLNLSSKELAHLNLFMLRHCKELEPYIK